ncbi:hypothetical protein BASA50_004682 [Batrachochytrium salamandrivorans]|uniref:Uncharacterized protein n=1 Tax=Batrachochytrium salamandrivorans TaxID=1357716 RepID=A0ABQ8FHR6_9FUNG|nr:hypothetical protein BASA50_004682 [Batrachochytrium salamandrivorans]
MKFNVLVAAAMVITCVNASGKGTTQRTSTEITKTWGSETKIVTELISCAPFQEPIKEYSICDLIVVELSASRDKIHDLDHGFWTYSPYFYDLMTGNGEKIGEDYEEEEVVVDEEEEMDKEKDDDEEKKINAEALRVEAIQKWIKSNPEAIPKLQEIKTESISLKENHFEIWARLLGNDCPIEEFEHLSPAGMKRRGYFSEWDYENGVDILGEQ